MNLFIQSDSIIHDCGSFIAEYLFTGKPCAYLQINGDSQLKSINKFGKQALEAYARVKCEEDLVEFIEGLIVGKSEINSKYCSFINDHIYPLYKYKRPSDIIVNYLTNVFKGGV